MPTSFLTAAALSLCAGLATAAHAQSTFAEVEPNETKAQANVVVLTGPGDMIVGNTTGTSTTTPGAASADTFRVKTPAAALGIYRHRLVITTPGTAGHTGTIRGTGQSAGVPTTADNAAQTSSSSTTPARFNQWYGFGKQEEIYYRVTGTSTTTSDYTSTYSVDPVVPFDAGTMYEGSINIGEGAGSGIDVDYWVYDSNLNAIPQYGCDNNENRTLSFTPGTYYLAWSNFNFANNQPAPLLTPPSTYDFAGTILDFPDAASNSSTTNVTNANLQITDSAGAHVFAFTRPNPFDIIWVKITVIAGAPVMGACCLTDGTCAVLSASACASQGGVYGGDNTVCGTCPQPGACCRPDGSCSFGLETACTAAGGVFRGEGVQCATQECPQPAGQVAEGPTDAGELPGTARVTVGTGALNAILGTASAPQDVDMYKIRIADPATFTASTVNAGTTWDTQLFLFDSAGLGVAANDDEVGGTSLQSRLTSQFVTGGAGQYYVAISRYNRDPASGGTSPIFNQVTSRSEVGATGAGAGAPVDAWINTVTATAGDYRITLTGVEFSDTGAPACYANCDGSTIEPALNVLDFNCFLNRFAAGESYANCDGSTIEPVLNVLDFNCFLNRFAAGCSAP